LSLVERTCSHAYLLQQGCLVHEGLPRDVIARYHETARIEAVPSGGRWGSGEIELMSVDFLGRDGRPAQSICTRDPLIIRLTYRAHQRVERPVFGLAIHRDDGTHVTGPNTKTSGFEIRTVDGDGALDYEIESLPLLPGRYLVSASAYDHDLAAAYDYRDRVKELLVAEGDTRERLGIMELRARWHRAGVPLAS
ncbi:MAG: Wzt carbohydrate-binding domain-containing protein, partial [Acidimicrobiia bacterium]